MSTTLQHYIDGHLVEGRSGRFADVRNPATGQVSGTVPLATGSELDAAVAAAQAAFPAWAATTPLRRSRVLNRFKELLELNAEKLAALITAEHGKVHSDALGEVVRGLEVVEFACGGPHLLKGEVSENIGSSIDSHSLRQPLGVVAGITPFNFPAMVALWMFPVALACGNTFVLKPSERDPSAALFLAELLQEAGLPAGVFNVVNGDKEAVDAILAHPDIQAVSFVGSTPIARHIYATGAANGKRVQALGGAKNHMVVMPDADLDKTADALMGAAYGAAGERCMAISIAVAVGDATADALIERLAPRVKALRIGPGTDPQAEMGPLITREHRDRVRSYVDIGVEEGASLVVDGREFRMQRLGFENGFYLGGSLFDQVTPEMRIYQDEIFGPVLGVVRVKTYKEAVELINAHQYANGTAIFTRDGDSARMFAHEIQVGMVGINVPIPVPMAFHSFGGWKNSLFGDHHMHGPEGVRFYTRLKTVTSRWMSGIRGGADFVMPTMK
ncbi:CoA-acylating methylmalonate-semialdehyde dehydrogenase [Pseudomonas sp. AOB-7]|jgi:malonate-semialdehyde dehydrogenase (acetylating)/methylmalonate-semialdehyde dehydrogenase|uniref:CoA-acylating methylmalonate-semialdehyde dehydrogenase n=1 Tax=Pseudomonas sp. AOB-7 TaxID=2482750 RepID=UPI000EFAC3FC|nr:CoA-acylating methylmalonate-semialdehyde dehydrogenase [Pseudomonas sp. AOB-7]RMH85058.1 CoA-acylating methylmalonate-semialdehyde dehydrogenase [Pseudomonas sp. AOB-7]